jgi:DNA-binding NarL/FixJ family response regulator
MTPQKNTVLIVDDSIESLNFLMDALESAGLMVLVALNGTTALSLVSRVQPDIILMDAVMPGIDGFETCRRLKADSAFADLPVIFMTGLSETEHIVEAFRAGGVDYVTKPIVPDELLVRMRRHLTNAQISRNARAALDATGRFLAAVDGSGKVVWCTPQASRLITEVLGVADIASFALPNDVFEQIVARGDTDRSGGATRMQIGESAISISYMGEVRGEVLLRLSIDEKTEEQQSLRNRFSLTEREADVLFWIARGKSNRDIGDILGLSHRTINKHLEQIYAKLSVENRASAAALAIRSLGDR